MQWLELAMLFLLEVQMTWAASDCMAIYNGTKQNFGGAVPSICRGEIDPACQIDLADIELSIAAPILKGVLDSGNRVCFGCDENDFVGQCHTIIVCSPQSQCYKNEVTSQLQNNNFPRYEYGCTVNSKYCHKQACLGNLCNGDSTIMSLVNKITGHASTTVVTTPITSTTTTTSTTSSPPTTSSSSSITTTPTTASGTRVPTTVPSTTILSNPTTTYTLHFTGSTPAIKPFAVCAEGGGDLFCYDERNQYFRCEDWISEYDICHWPGSSHNITLEKCPYSCNMCEERCKEEFSKISAQGGQ